MKKTAIAVICAVSVASFASAAVAKRTDEPTIQNIDHNLAEEIDHNAIAEDSSADATIVLPPDPSTVGKPRPKAKPNKHLAKEIPLIDDDYEGKSSDDVSYVTGGIGKDEREAIEASKADYNLYVMSANIDGAFVGDTHVVITRKQGNEVEEVLNVDSGPLLYVRLPAGSYTLIATLGEQTKEQKLVVNAQGKPSTVRLSWKLAQ